MWSVGLGLVIAGAIVVIAATRPGGKEKAIRACNGHEELCSRSLDRVAFPATHNAMSSKATRRWLFAQQERKIPDQLRDGIRALLIDAHYGFPGRLVYTDVKLDAKLRAKKVKENGREFVAAAERLRRQVAQPKGNRRAYLCHGFCELGAIPLDDTLVAIRKFLDRNPNEVLLLVIEDYVKPDDIEAAFERSGLIRYVYKGPAGPPWPTLRRMIEDDQRVLVMAEHDAGNVPWYDQAYELMQETPYTFRSKEKMSCKQNRGAPSNSLFLINHWISSDPAPKPSNAKVVNDYKFLLQRVRKCQRQRGSFPNVIAVDFYRTGDLFDVVDRVNGVAATARDATPPKQGSEPARDR